MQYVSTRGRSDPLSFSDAVMTGLARDGGLLVPSGIPDLRKEMDALRTCAYRDLAFSVMRPFMDLPDDALRRLIRCSYAAFRDPEVTPLRPLGDAYVLELFHGPTLAFKDIALQMLGNLFEIILDSRKKNMNIVAATSGDTGSAAIHGVKGRTGIRIFVLHPKGRTSPLQERQMTTVLDERVHNLAVNGSFDDCQAMVKAVFNDLNFRDRYGLGAVNSINWARILAQIVYYAYAALRVTGQTGADRVRFAVPTGNFGDIFAGWMAARMGFPIAKLVLATNANNILARFFETGVYRMTAVTPTISPSMDIQVASNFERYLYYRQDEEGTAVEALMETFGTTGELSLPPPAGEGGMDPLIVAATADEEQTLAAIRSVYAATGYLLDPHSAVGYHAGKMFRSGEEPMVHLATAHPAKFPDAIRAALGADLGRHPMMDALDGLPVRCEDLNASAEDLKRYVACRIDGCRH